MMKILVYIQRAGDSIGRNSIEALAGAQKFVVESGGDVTAVCFDSSLTDKLTGYNISEVITVSNDGLNTYSPLHFTAAMEQVIADTAANVVIFGHTYQVRDWVPRLSARLDAPFISDCVDADGTEGLTGIRQVYQGKINTNISAEGLVLISFQSGAFRADSVEEGSASTRKLDVDLLTSVSDELEYENLREISLMDEKTKGYFQYLISYLNSSSHMRIVFER